MRRNVDCSHGAGRGDPQELATDLRKITQAREVAYTTPGKGDGGVIHNDFDIIWTRCFLARLHRHPYDFCVPSSFCDRRAYDAVPHPALVICTAWRVRGTDWCAARIGGLQAVDEAIKNHLDSMSDRFGELPLGKSEIEEKTAIEKQHEIDQLTAWISGEQETAQVVPLLLLLLAGFW